MIQHITYGCDLLQQNNRKQNRQREKIHGSIWRKLGSSFQSPLPGESHRMCLILPVAIYDNTSEKLTTGEARWALSTWGI